MKKFIILSTLLAVMLFTAGCTGGPKENITDSQGAEGTVTATEAQKNSSESQGTPEKNVVIEVTQLEQINASLQNSPVLVKIGIESCGPCQEMKPILNELAAEYEGKATIVSIDADQSLKIANYFGVYEYPDSFVIVGIENSEYVYMRENGDVTKDRFKARILGLRNKEVFEKVLDFAIQEKK